MVVRRSRECKKWETPENGDNTSCFADVRGEMICGYGVEGKGLKS
jgi:hypothetical protein